MDAQPPQTTGSRLHPIRSETWPRHYPSRATTPDPDKSHQTLCTCAVTRNAIMHKQQPRSVERRVDPGLDDGDDLFVHQGIERIGQAELVEVGIMDDEGVP